MSSDQVKRRNGWRRNCDVGEVTEMLENELQPFRRFTYVTAHSLTLPLLHLRHSSFFKPFFLFSYVSSSSLNSPGEPPMEGNRFLMVNSKYCSTSSPALAQPVAGRLGQQAGRNDNLQQNSSFAVSPVFTLDIGPAQLSLNFSLSLWPPQCGASCQRGFHRSLKSLWSRGTERAKPISTSTKNLMDFKQFINTERGGSVVTHGTRIREVPGSNPGADQPD